MCYCEDERNTAGANSMNPVRPTGWDVFLAMGLISMAISALPSPAQPSIGGQAPSELRILTLQGTAEVSIDGGANWVSTQTNQVLKPQWRLRTSANSRVTLRWSDQSVVPFGSLTEIEILPPDQAGALSGLRLFKGIPSFFHRDKPGQIRLVTRGAVAGVEGTEFVLAVDAVDENRTTISLIDGRVRFSNEHGELTLTNGQQAIGEAGRAPLLTA